MCQGFWKIKLVVWSFNSFLKFVYKGASSCCFVLFYHLSSILFYEEIGFRTRWNLDDEYEVSIRILLIGLSQEQTAHYRTLNPQSADHIYLRKYPSMRNYYFICLWIFTKNSLTQDIIFNLQLSSMIKTYFWSFN